MVLSLFMQLIGVLIPPLPVLILMIVSDVLGLVMIIQLLDIGRRLGYNILDTFKALIVGGLTIYALTYPLVVYLTKSAISDIPWMRTPKASRALETGRIIIEQSVMLIMLVLGIIFLLMRRPLISIYMITNAVLILTGYRIGIVKIPMDKSN